MTTASAKAYKGMGVEGPIAKWYATNTRKALDEFKALALPSILRTAQWQQCSRSRTWTRIFRHRACQTRRLPCHRSRYQQDVC